MKKIENPNLLENSVSRGAIIIDKHYLVGGPTINLPSCFCNGQDCGREMKAQFSFHNA